MPEVKFSHIVSCSSEEKQNPAENLLRGQTYKKWKCKAGETNASVIVQLERAVQIQSMDIGNEASAFIEIFGGRSTSTLADDDFKTILPTAGFMTPEDSRKESNLNAVRFFDAEKLTKEGREEKWDRLKIVCSQPFNKNLSFGLSFIKVHSVATTINDEDVNKEKTAATIGGRFRLKDDVEDEQPGILDRSITNFVPGSLFSARNKKTTEETTPTSSPVTSTTTSAMETTSSKSNDKMEWFAHGKRKTDESKNGTGESSAIDVKKRKPAAPSASSTTKKTPPPPESRKKESNLERPSGKPPAKKAKDVPFDKLLDDVVFVLSGFQNPLRSELRDRAIEMGAKYRGDWGPGCTHLICAFSNTPKYNQVKGKGKIVKKEWVNDCHKEKRLFDWKRYSFEKMAADDSDEDDDVRMELVKKTATSRTPKDDKKKPTNGGGDDSGGKKRSIEKKETSAATSSATKPKRSSSSNDDPYGVATDYSDDDTDDEIRRVRTKQRKTNNDDLDKSNASSSSKPKSTSPNKKNGGDGLPELPDFFEGMRFFFYGGFPESDRKQLNRLIVAFDGVTESYMNNKVTHVLTRERWDYSFDEASRDFPRIVFVRPDFVSDCGREERKLDIDQYRVKKS